MTLFVGHMNDIVCYIVHMQTGMDGIQFSFGIGAFPFAMMGGVSIGNNFIVYTKLKKVSSSSQCFKCLGTDREASIYCYLK